MNGDAGRNWQVQYNRDQDIWYYLDEPVTLESLHRFIDPIIERVDLYLIDAGSQFQHYPTKVGEMFASDEAHWQSLMQSPPKGSDIEFFTRLKAHFRTLMEQVGDPMACILARCREKGIQAGVTGRVNDRHYCRLADHFTFDRFCREHGDWRLPNGGFDFRIEDVRARRLSFLKEYGDHFADMDVLELDFMRTSEFFTEDVPRDERFRLMNDFVREIREHALAVGERRGRPITLQARVPITVAGCEGVGLDVGTWAREGWVDALVPAPGYSAEFDTPIEDFRALDGTGSLKVYAGFEGYLIPEGDPPRIPTREILRAATAKHARRGADGVHFFNSFTWDLATELANLDAARDPAEVAGRDKLYLTAIPREHHRRRGVALPCPLPAALSPDEPVRIEFLVADDFREHPPASLRFRVQLRGISPENGEPPRITINGNELAGPGEWQPAYRPWMGDSRDNDYMDPWLEFETRPDMWRQDGNEVTVALPANGKAGVILRGMELDVVH